MIIHKYLQELITAYQPHTNKKILITSVANTYKIKQQNQQKQLIKPSVVQQVKKQKSQEIRRRPSILNPLGFGLTAGSVYGMYDLYNLSKEGE